MSADTTGASPAAPAALDLPPAIIPPGWDYDEAFCRNRGLVSPDEQMRLRRARVAIAGMGGVGGIDLVTLTRLGIGRFTIADPDTFSLANFNRQYGARLDTLDRSKAEVMAEAARAINPEVEIRLLKQRLRPENAEEFLRDADVFVDGIDAFEIDIRRLLFRLAQERGLYAMSAGPVGFSAVWVVFDPKGMTFDRYFDITDKLDAVEKFAAFIVGMAPKATHRAYTDLSYVNVQAHTGPSLGLACSLAAGVVGAEVLKMLLGRGRLRPAPYYHQFDPYIGKLVRSRLWGGNRHPLQRLKRRLLTAFLRKRLQA